MIFTPASISRFRISPTRPPSVFKYAAGAEPKPNGVTKNRSVRMRPSSCRHCRPNANIAERRLDVCDEREREAVIAFYPNRLNRGGIDAFLGRQDLIESPDSLHVGVAAFLVHHRAFANDVVDN